MIEEKSRSIRFQSDPLVPGNHFDTHHSLLPLRSISAPFMNYQKEELMGGGVAFKFSRDKMVPQLKGEKQVPESLAAHQMLFTKPRETAFKRYVSIRTVAHLVELRVTPRKINAGLEITITDSSPRGNHLAAAQIFEEYLIAHNFTLDTPEASDA